MSDQTAFVIAVACKWLAVGLLGGLAYLLMDAGKDGWGWLLFLAFVGMNVSYRTTPDAKEEG